MMSAVTLVSVKQAVRDQRLSFSARDENGFASAEAAELKRRIQEVRKGKGVQHELLEN